MTRSMDRRDFLRHGGVMSASLALPGAARALPEAHDTGWRTFEVTTHVEVLQPAGPTRIWLPTPLTTATPYQKPLGNTITADGGHATTVNDAPYANGIASIEFPAGVKPVAVLTSRVATRDHRVSLTARPVVVTL